MPKTDSEVSNPDNTNPDMSDLQRQWFNVALASIGDAVITTDAEGNVTFLNPVAETLTGWSLAEARGLPVAKVFRIVHEDTREPVDNPALRALRDGQVAKLSNHTLLLNRNGQEIAIDDSGAPIISGDTSIGSVLVFRDISERRQGERARALLAEIVGSSEDAIISKTLDGIITSWNKAAERMFEYTAEEAVGNSITLIIPPDRLNEEKEILRKLRRGERIEHFDTIRITKSGKARNISVTVSPVRDRTGTIIGASKTARDITDRIRADEERTRLHASESAARHEAELASRAKDEFLAMVSHEIRSPLNAILGWAEILDREDLDRDGVKRAADTIKRNARSQVQLLSDLLDISRVVTGKLNIDLRPLDVRYSLERAMESIKPAAQAKSIEIVVDETNANALVAGDADRLQQVFWNLLANAVKFTPEHGRISVSVKHIQSSIAIEVSDTGIGIKPEFLPRVFNRFSQADPTSTRQHGGLGLGLAIVRHLIELHGGSVGASSDGEDKGATFTVKLPVYGTHEERRQTNAHVSLEGLTQLVEGITLADVKVLVVDDEADARDFLTLILEMHGAQVKSSASAADAIAQLEAWHPAIMLSDISMPQEDGYSLIRRIRNLPTSSRSVPAVALTAYARPEDRMRALAAGFQMHIAKPVEAAELVMVVASLAGRAPVG